MTGETQQAQGHSEGAFDFSSHLTNFRAGVIIVLAALLVYHNSFQVPFLFDDAKTILENTTIRSLWPVWTALSPPAGGLPVSGRPVLNFTFALNWAISGEAVWSYHAVNFCIHALAGLFLLGAVRRTLQLLNWKEKDAAAVAMVVALLWTLHPLQTEAVTYISQRAESLVGLFYVLTCYCFIRGAGSPRPGGWFAGAIGCCLLGMGTKEVMVSAPLLVLLYDRTFVAGSFKEAWQRRRRVHLGLAATWLLLAWLVVNSSQRGGTAGTGLGISSWQYLLTQCHAIVLYLKLTFWPHPLVFDYGIWLARGSTTVIPQVLLLLSVAAGTLLAVWRWPALGFLGVWFFAILAPSSSVVPVATQTMAEHRMYLPLAAVILSIVLALHAWLGRRALPVCLAGAVVWGFLTERRNFDYRSASAIWSDTMAKQPDNHRAHIGFAIDLIDHGQIDQAIVHCTEALRLQPHDPEAHFNLGNAFSVQNRLEESIAHYQEALRMRPDDARAHNNLGNTLNSLGRFEEAVIHCTEALRLRPDYPEAENNLGNALNSLGKIEESIVHYQKALQQRPNYAKAHANLARACVMRGRFDEAISHFREALRLSPEQKDFLPMLAGAHYKFGLKLADDKNPASAVTQLREALRLTPDSIDVLNTLAWILATTSDAALRNGLEAVQLAERAAHLTANQSPSILDTLAAAFAESNRFEEAVKTAQKALELATVSRDEHLSRQIRSHLETYQVGKPMRE